MNRMMLSNELIIAYFAYNEFFKIFELTPCRRVVRRVRELSVHYKLNVDVTKMCGECKQFPASSC